MGRTVFDFIVFSTGIIFGAVFIATVLRGLIKLFIWIWEDFDK